ncbi:hypothetical protein LCGC14_2501540, partial [marine sediment metagenome]
MSIDDVTIAEARRRIRAAYDPNLLGMAGHKLAELLATHMARVQASGGRVLNWEDAQKNIAKATSILAEGDNSAGDNSVDDVDGLAEHFAGLVRTMLDHGHNLHDPRYLGHQVPAPVPIAGWFDAVGSVTNQVMAIYEMGPWASSVEEAMVRRLGSLIGFPPGEFAGMVTHGGSLANLTALLTARNVVLGDVWENGLGISTEAPKGTETPGTETSTGTPKGTVPFSLRENWDSPRHAPVLVAHAEAHYSVARAAGILGLGTRQIVRAELDRLGRIDPERLDRTLRRLRAENRPIVAVVACSCATPIGAFDPLQSIAEVCHKHDVWLHVAAAHG